MLRNGIRLRTALRRWTQLTPVVAAAALLTWAAPSPGQAPPPLQEVILEPGTTSVLEPGARTRVTCIEPTAAVRPQDEAEASSAFARRDAAPAEKADLFWLCECTRPGFPRLVRKLLTAKGTVVAEQTLAEFVEQGDEASLQRKCDRARKKAPLCADSGDLQQASGR